MKHLLEDVRIFMPTCSAHGKKNHFQAEESPTVRVLLLTYNPGIGCTTGSAWSFESCPLFGQTMLIFLFCSSVCVCVDSWRLTLETEAEVKSQSTFVAHWKCSCMTAPTIPTAVKFRSRGHCCCDGPALASVRFSFCCFEWESLNQTGF